MPAYEAYETNRDAHDITDSIPLDVRMGLRKRPQIVSRRPLTPAEAAQSAALNTPESLAGQPPITGNAVDAALNTKPSVDQLLNTPAPTPGKSRYDTAMDQLDSVLKSVLHGDTQPQGGGAVSTVTNYPQAPNEYQIDSRTGNYDTNVPGGSVQDAISKIGNPGMDYNASTGEWIPSNTPSIINGKTIPVSPPGQSTINGKPSAQAIDESYSRNVTAGVHADFRDQSAPIKISNPAPNGVEWPELPSSAFSLGLNEKKDKDQLRFY